MPGRLKSLSDIEICRRWAEGRHVHLCIQLLLVCKGRFGDERRGSYARGKSEEEEGRESKGWEGGREATVKCQRQQENQSRPSAASVFARVHTSVLLPSRH